MEKFKGSGASGQVVIDRARAKGLLREFFELTTAVSNAFGMLKLVEEGTLDVQRYIDPEAVREDYITKGLRESSSLLALLETFLEVANIKEPLFVDEPLYATEPEVEAFASAVAH